MLIIFDLDDTLVDTSRSITPYRLQEALRAMVEKGLPVSDFASSLKNLIEVDSESPNAEYALKVFLQKMGAEEHFFEVGKEIVYRNKDLTMDVHATADAASVLQKLSRQHTLALVTVGEEDLQRLKLKKAGLDVTVFSMIVVTPHKDKKAHYAKIIEDLKVRPNEIVVCGDKIDIDLLPAKELGLTTVHMKHGRGVYSRGNPLSVDFTITKLVELEEIINNIRKQERN